MTHKGKRQSESSHCADTTSSNVGVSALSLFVICAVMQLSGVMLAREAQSFQKFFFPFFLSNVHKQVCSKILS